MPKQRILIIEDEEDLLYLYDYHLSKSGYQVISAATGRKGLQAVKKYRLDLIILDRVLPDMDGLECFRIIRESSRVPVLFLTARRAVSDRGHDLDLEATRYLAKPCSIEMLVSYVKSLALSPSGLKPGSA